MTDAPIEKWDGGESALSEIETRVGEQPDVADAIVLRVVVAKSVAEDGDERSIRIFDSSRITGAAEKSQQLGCVRDRSGLPVIARLVVFTQRCGFQPWRGDVGTVGPSEAGA